MLVHPHHMDRVNPTRIGSDPTSMSTNEPTGQEVSGTTEEELMNLIEVRSDDDSAGLTDIWIAGIPLGKLLDKALQNSSEALEVAKSDSVEDDEPAQDDADGTEDDTLPIERMAQLRESDPDHPALPTNGRQSFDRAVTIYEHFRQWSKKTPSGHTITSNLKSLLSTATGEELAWKQCYRACRKLVEWSKGAVTFKKTRRHGWILVADELPSSAKIG